MLKIMIMCTIGNIHEDRFAEIYTSIFYDPLNYDRISTVKNNFWILLAP